MSVCDFCCYPIGETDLTNKMKNLIRLNKLKDKFGKLLYPDSNFAYCLDCWKNKKDELHPNQKSGQWTFSNNLNIFDDAHAVIVLTEWDDYKNIEWDLVAKNMVKPSWVFDSRSIVNAEEVKKAGMNLWSLGDGSSKDEKAVF